MFWSIMVCCVIYIFFGGGEGAGGIGLDVMVSCLKIGVIFPFQLLVSKVCSRLSRVEMNQSQNCLITLLVSKGTLSSPILYWSFTPIIKIAVPIL